MTSTAREPFLDGELQRIRIFYFTFKEGSSASVQRHLVFSPPTIINGNVSMARFGHAITSLGDINNDGYKGTLAVLARFSQRWLGKSMIASSNS